MLCVLAIAGGLLLAWMLGSWLEWRHMQHMMKEFGQRFPGRCMVCSLEDHLAREMIPLKQIAHHCSEHIGRSDVLPASRNGSEVAPVEGEP